MAAAPLHSPGLTSCLHARPGVSHPPISCANKVFIGLKPQSSCPFGSARPNLTTDFYEKVTKSLQSRAGPMLHPTYTCVRHSSSIHTHTHTHTHTQMSSSSSLTLNFVPRKTGIGFNHRPKTLTPFAALSDPLVLEIAETLENYLSSSSSSSSTPVPLQKLRDSSSESLLSLSWPSRKDEPFRFTDTSFMKSSLIQPTSPPQESDFSIISVDTHMPNIVIVDGFLVDSLSSMSGLPEGVFVGSLSKLSSEAAIKRVSGFVANFNGDLFWSLNGVGAPDLVVVYVPEGCRVENPIHLRYYSMQGTEFGSNTLPISNPRVLVLVEKGGEVSIVEEYVGGEGAKSYWTNAVLELEIAEGATVSHSYLQTQSVGAAHIKWTSVRQESGSTYKLVELSSGGKLGRHNLHIQQAGPGTVTELSTLHLSVHDQTQDLHSRLILEHPRGYSRQLHKCIVAHSRGQAVFDGNVRVNRYAQQTDAGQLTRSLLLVPQATVNLKPNLQIIADDVKCSHGAAISDLEDDQLFYFRARGIDFETARKSLIFSFGAEVIQRFPFPSIRDKAKAHLARLLDPALALD